MTKAKKHPVFETKRTTNFRSWKYQTKRTRSEILLLKLLKKSLTKRIQLRNGVTLTRLIRTILL